MITDYIKKFIVLFLFKNCRRSKTPVNCIRANRRKRNQRSRKEKGKGERKGKDNFTDQGRKLKF